MAASVRMNDVNSVDIWVTVMNDIYGGVIYYCLLLLYRNPCNKQREIDFKHCNVITECQSISNQRSFCSERFLFRKYKKKRGPAWIRTVIAAWTVFVLVLTPWKKLGRTLKKENRDKSIGDTLACKFFCLVSFFLADSVFSALNTSALIKKLQSRSPPLTWLPPLHLILLEVKSLTMKL